jgi:DNA-directed RNA polymerase subunit L
LILRVDSLAENAISVQIDKEDYSIADIVHRELLNVKHVKFAGVPPPHPLIKTLTIQVHTDGAKPTKSLLEAIEASQGKISDLLQAARQAFPGGVVKQAPTPSVSEPSNQSQPSGQST